jgi:hypothetical protein
MPDIVIQAENLGKKYTIGHQTENGRYVALRDMLINIRRGEFELNYGIIETGTGIVIF